MTNTEIKAEKDRCFEQIELAKERLEEIRKICKHEKTFEGNYSWRVGCIQPAIICEYCGELIEYKDSDEKVNTQVLPDCPLEDEPTQEIQNYPTWVMSTYKFPNGMIITCDYDGEQIPELQGKYSKELVEKIKQRSDQRTIWNGF